MDGIVEKHFENMGARVRILAPERRTRRWRRAFADEEPQAVRLDIGTDRRGEYFDLQVDPTQATIEVVDALPQQRHLLLLSRNLDTGEKDKFLCGHDERHWFVAAIPPGSASNVATAMDALMPAKVVEELSRRRVRTKNRHRRSNEAFIRQGEWFFVPEPNAIPDDHPVVRNEPIRRGLGKAHMVEFLARTEGETVRVSRQHPHGLTDKEYAAVIQENRHAKHWHWRLMRRDATVFAKGRVSHPDHRTISLVGWHRVLMNRESAAPAMRHVVFLD